MKKQILGWAVLMAIAANLIPAEVSAVSMNQRSHAYIVDSVAFPQNPRVNNATHQFKLQVQDRSLTQLQIEIPERVRVGTIRVTDREGRIIPTNFAIADRQATISFAEPVVPHSYLRVDLQNVATPHFSNTWLYFIHGQMEGLNGNIPLGTARIQTYR
ncbi:MAG: DUF2808 domain-containing protein [Chroococcales cyanobacterium]